MSVDGPWDERGRLHGWSYHDGNLTGVCVDADTAVLSIRPVGAEPYELWLLGVRDLCCDGFRLGNIVLDVEFLPYARWSSDPSYRERVVKRFYELPKKPTSLFCLDSSYGAEILCLCESVEPRQEPATPETLEFPMWVDGDKRLLSHVLENVPREMRWQLRWFDGVVGDGSWLPEQDGWVQTDLEDARLRELANALEDLNEIVLIGFLANSSFRLEATDSTYWTVSFHQRDRAVIEDWFGKFFHSGESP